MLQSSTTSADQARRRRRDERLIIGSRRQDSDDQEVPAKLARRESQDSARSRTGSGRASSPPGSMGVDAPKHRDNEEGHRQKKRD
jgi:hypothetical protein